MGPVLYCHESVDNRIDVDDIFLSKNTIFKKVPKIINDEKIIALHYDAIKKKDLKKTKTVSIPYYLRCNRESSRAQVWLDSQYFFNLKGYTKNISKVDLLKVIALKEGKTCGQMAINWVLRQPGLTTALVGVKNPVQMEENLISIVWQPSKENCEKIEQIFSSAD